MHLSRRTFAKSLAIATIATTTNSETFLYGAPPNSSDPKVPNSAFPALTVNFVPGVFFDRYADLGGVLDTQTGIIWGYEPYASLVNGSISFTSVLQLDSRYKSILLNYSQNGTATEKPVFAAAYAVANQRTWRAPTVFEARDAVQKGLFTFGASGCNLYFGSPMYQQPGVSYGLGNLRWSTSVTPKGMVHAWSAADGGTMVVSKTSGLLAIVVSQL